MQKLRYHHKVFPLKIHAGEMPPKAKPPCHEPARTETRPPINQTKPRLKLLKRPPHQDVLFLLLVLLQELDPLQG